MEFSSSMANSLVTFEHFLSNKILEFYKKLLCENCQKILRSAVQIVGCNHALCKECAEKLMLYAKYNER